MLYNGGMENVTSLQTKTKEELLNFVCDEIQKYGVEKNNLETLVAEQENKIVYLEERVALLMQERFCARSEKFGMAEQGNLFDEALVAAQEELTIEAADEELTQIAGYTRSKKSGRKPLPSYLPREEIHHALPDDQKQCSCGCILTKIGDVRSEQLDIIPAQMKVLVHVREKWACKACEDTIVTAELPAQPIPKSMASAGLLAHVLVCKYEDHLPLYRQEAILQRIGVDIPRSTLSHWMIRAGQLLQPLVEQMQQIIRGYDIAYADETPVQVLKEKGRPAMRQSTMWYFAGGNTEQRCVIYQYDPTRAGVVAREFLDGFSGYLHCDGYSGYEQLFTKHNLAHVACWAHARRKFVEVIKSSKQPSGVAVMVVDLIAKLYHLEKQGKLQGLLPEKIYAQRQANAKPIVHSIKQHLEEQRPKIPPESRLAKAINYALNQWNGLLTYLEDGRLEIDNNASERGIKTFVIGRKNWLFYDQPDGAHAGATIYSLIQTCKLHGVEPYAYFRHVLAALPTVTTGEERVALLPFNYLKPVAVTAS